MVKKDNYALLYRVANYYYNDGLSQDEIARIENFSRPHISRLLDRAKEVGIVKTTVVMPEILSTEKIASQLKELLNLKDVAVCPGDSNPKNEASYEIAQYAVDVLNDFLEDSHHIGLGWGYTLYHTAKMINHKIRNKDLTFVPLLGVSPLNSQYHINNNIVNLFAENSDAKGYYCSAPLVQNKEQLSDVEKRSLEKLEEQWEQIDATIIGVGGPPSDDLIRNDPLTSEFNEYIQSSDIDGVILVHYFDKNGNDLSKELEKHFHIATYDLERLKDLKVSVCLAGGEEKADALIMFAKKRFFNKLITDENTARIIIEKLK